MRNRQRTHSATVADECVTFDAGRKIPNSDDAIVAARR
jgi:hypothetical protein